MLRLPLDKSSQASEDQGFVIKRTTKKILKSRISHYRMFVCLSPKRRRHCVAISSLSFTSAEQLFADDFAPGVAGDIATADYDAHTFTRLELYIFR